VTDQDAAREAERRRKQRERVFGEVLPETTTDDARDGQDDEAQDDWLRRQVPPHHG
jgi:hypothetical protein